MTEDKASSSHVVVPIPTSLEEGGALNVLPLLLKFAALPHFVLISFSAFWSRGVGASRDEER